MRGPDCSDLTGEINLVFWNTVKSRFYDRLSNDIPNLTINFLCYSKLHGTESQFNNNRFNNNPGLTMEI